MGKLDIKAQRNGEKLNITLSGVIDEDVDFSGANLSGAQQIDFQLESVKSINSCGIREWIKWMSSAAGAQMTWHSCPKVLIDQVNMVDGFLPTNAKIMSFFVPYYCDDSGSEKNILFRFGHEFKEGSVTPPASVKDDEGGEMEMDVIESKYFKFIKK